MEEIAAAWKVRSGYLQEHPNDWEMFDVGSMLSRLEEALRAVGEAPAEPTLPVATPARVGANHHCLEKTTRDRREVLDLCYSAHTLAGVKAAEVARASYLARHPEDGEILDMGELLTLLEEALTIVGKAPTEPPLPAAAPVEAAT